jgi:phosphoribosylglycinamide formyltransferase-1
MKRRIITLGVLVSGNGSNLQAIIDRIEARTLDARIAVVISNDPGAFALERAARRGIPVVKVPSGAYPSREAADAAMVEVLNECGVELVVLAGFMRLLSEAFLRAFPMRIINIHPALLPAFPGVHSQQQAADYGVKFSGCTVHFVDQGVDTGPIIVQAVVPVEEADTEATLGARILEEEHRIFPQAIQWYAEGRLRVEGRKVLLEAGRTCGRVALHQPALEAGPGAFGKEE